MFWHGLLLLLFLRRLIPLAVVVLLIWLVVRALKTRRGQTGDAKDPVNILKIRYARGEISREEYQKMKEELKA